MAPGRPERNLSGGPVQVGTQWLVPRDKHKDFSRPFSSSASSRVSDARSKIFDDDHGLLLLHDASSDAPPLELQEGTLLSSISWEFVEVYFYSAIYSKRFGRFFPCREAAAHAAEFARLFRRHPASFVAPGRARWLHTASCPTSRPCLFSCLFHLHSSLPLLESPHPLPLFPQEWRERRSLRSCPGDFPLADDGKGQPYSTLKRSTLSFPSTGPRGSRTLRASCPSRRR